jgi:hypothetical protein
MSLVAVESSFIDMLIIIAGVFAIGLIVVVGLWAYSEHRIPREGKTLRKAKARKLPVILIAGLSHFADLFHVNEFIAKVMETDRIGRGRYKTRLRFQLPDKARVDSLDVEEGMDEEKTKELLNLILKHNSEQVFLRDTRTPITIAVRDLPIAAGIKGIGALTFIKKLWRVKQLEDKIKALKKSEKFKDLGDLLDEFRREVSVVDFDAIWQNIQLSWDPTMDESISEKDQSIGAKEATKMQAGQFKMLLIIGGVVCIVLVIVGLIAFLLGTGMVG